MSGLNCMTPKTEKCYNAKIQKIGNSLGIILPKEICDELKLNENDTVTFKFTDNGVQIVHQDPEYEKMIAIGKEVMKRRRSLLKALAKN